MSPPTVSIIIPCYNEERYVGAAIKSALDQTYEPTEVFVIDDGSTDGSLDAIRSFDEQIVWRTGENRGACHARNWGVKLASGKFIKFLDADDVLFEDAVQTQVNQVREISDDRVIVYGDGCDIREEGGRETSRTWTHARERREEEDALEYLIEVTPQTPLPLHRRSLIEEVGGFDERLPHFQDFDLHLRLCLSNIEFRYMPAKVAKFRCHEGRRITTTGHFASDPKGRLRRIQRWVGMIREEKRGGLTDSLGKCFAQHAWNGGRIALRNGDPELAREYFNYASELHDECIAGNTPVYKWIVRLLGPEVAESIGNEVRSIKQ